MQLIYQATVFIKINYILIETYMHYACCLIYSANVKAVFLDTWGGFHERLKHETFVSNYWNIFLEPMGSAFMDFTKGLSLSFG